MVHFWHMDKKFHIHPTKKFEVLGTIRTYEDTTLLSQVEPIEEGGVSIHNREDLAHCVEAPLLEACQQLFDKGIRTVFSSANKKDVGRFAHIALDFETLSPDNQEIASRLGEEGHLHGSRPRKGIFLQIPVTETSTLGEIKHQALGMASQFENQTNVAEDQKPAFY
jgi:hypothetical protein